MIMGQRILIIDDNQSDVLITERVLARSGLDIQTEIATSGEAGLAFLRAAKELPAMILLDLKMPGMDGLEFLRRIRSSETLGHIPAIIVTHSALESDVTAANLAGANGVLHKAFDLDQFGREIKELLERWLKK